MKILRYSVFILFLITLFTFVWFNIAQLSVDDTFPSITIDGEKWEHVGGTLVFAQNDADMITDSMKRAMDETERRRAIQMKYNEEHGITPQTVRKAVRDLISISKKVAQSELQMAKDPESYAIEYDKKIEAAGGIDLQLLGIGLDGHIGFNEPDSHFEKATHRVVLDPSTIDANARFFESRDDVPREAVTMGMGGIMGAKKVLLIANGKNKKDIVEKSFFGPITPEVPASILQLHPDLTVIYSEN